ncbi:hypothetical protein P167DRAFT_183608 [Morchella conica CCBAS932]|uniref:Uncharacterized protein n=1 Tax=Morchella conica CCBAS932 TaxID=1392247 RepID=A0A3N4KUF4_9PEZI|nr:hypothetical protein P167DRAFT_183608 [Morchella conica CCBAS932]
MLLANLVFIIIHLIVWVLIRAKKKTATGPRAEKLEHTNTYLRNITKFGRIIWRPLRFIIKYLLAPIMFSLRYRKQLGWFLTVVTMVARVYIILECFLSVRRLPEGSFRTVPWEDVVPHL